MRHKIIYTMGPSTRTTDDCPVLLKGHGIEKVKNGALWGAGRETTAPRLILLLPSQSPSLS